MLYETTNKKGQACLKEVISDTMKALIDREQKQILKRKVKLYQVLRYDHTGSHFFFGVSPHDNTEIHLWVLEESLPETPTNYKGKVTSEPRFYSREYKCIYIDCGYGGETLLLSDKIKYVSKQKYAAPLQKIVEIAKAEHAKLTKEEWKRKYR